MTDRETMSNKRDKSVFRLLDSRRYKSALNEIAEIRQILKLGNRFSNKPMNYSNFLFGMLLVHYLLFASVLPTWLIASEIFLLALAFVHCKKGYKSNSLAWSLRLINIVLLVFIAIAMGEQFHPTIKIAIFVCYMLGVLVSGKLHRIRAFLVLFTLLALLGLVLSRSINLLYIFLLNMDALFLFFAFTKVHQTPEASQAARKLVGETAKILMLIIPVSMTAYFLLPRGGSRSISLYDKGSFTSGFNESLNPGRISNLSLSRKIVFRAKFLDKTPAYNQLYWRGEILWQSNGLSWSRGTPVPKLEKSMQPTEMVQQEIFLEAKYRDWAFALDTPLKIEERTKKKVSFIHIDPGQTFKRLGAEYEKQNYYAFSVLKSDVEAKVAEEIFLQTPKTVGKKIDAFVQNNLSTLGDTASKVEFLKKHLKQKDYMYSLTPGKTGNDLEKFWFEHKKGFCEHFAASIATIMRLANIPARVVLGFHGGQYNRLSNTYTVRELHAHAWVEYWEDGWQRFDATTYIAPERLLNGPEEWLSRDSGLAASFLNLVYSAQENLENSLAFLNIWVQRLGRLLSFPSTPEEWLNRVLTLIYVLISSILFIGTYFFFRNRNKDEQKKAVAKVDAFFQNVENILAKRHLKREIHEGRIEYLTRILETYSDRAENQETHKELTQFKEIYTELRYSGRVSKDKVSQIQKSTTWLKRNL